MLSQAPAARGSPPPACLLVGFLGGALFELESIPLGKFGMTKLIHLPLEVGVRIKLRPDKKLWARFVLTTNKKNSPNLCQHQKNLGVCVCVCGGGS